MLRLKCRESGIGFSCEEISEGYTQMRSRTVNAVERGLFTPRIVPADFDPEDLTVVCAANPYYEAESAAAYIWYLVRDLGYRMSDIQVIANDEGSISNASHFSTLSLLSLRNTFCFSLSGNHQTARQHRRGNRESCWILSYQAWKNNQKTDKATSAKWYLA